MNVGVAPLFRSCAVRSLNRQLRLFPCFPTTWNIPELLEALLLQNARGDAGAITAATINRGWFVAIKLAYPFAKLRDENMSGACNAPLLPFSWRTHIDHLQRRLEFIQLVYAHLSDSFQRIPRRMPRLHPADQIPREFCVSGSNKQTEDP